MASQIVTVTRKLKVISLKTRFSIKIKSDMVLL